MRKGGFTGGGRGWKEEVDETGGGKFRVLGFFWVRTREGRESRWLGVVVFKKRSC